MVSSLWQLPATRGKGDSTWCIYWQSHRSIATRIGVSRQNNIRMKRRRARDRARARPRSLGCCNAATIMRGKECAVAAVMRIPAVAHQANPECVMEHPQRRRPCAPRGTCMRGGVTAISGRGLGNENAQSDTQIERPQIETSRLHYGPIAPSTGMIDQVIAPSLPSPVATHDSRLSARSRFN